MAARARHPRLGADVTVAAALGQQQNPQPCRRAECRREQRGIGGGEVCDGGNAHAGKLFGGLRADAPQGVDLAIAHHRHPVLVGELIDAGRFAETGGDLGALFVVADADRTRQLRCARDDFADLLGEGDRTVDVGAEVGLVPAPHLDGVTEIAQHRHHAFGRFVVGGRIEGQERRIRALAGRGAQRHACVHTETARGVGRARDHLARFVGVAVAADNDWQTGQFGPAAHFDSGLKLIEVDVQDPPLDHRLFARALIAVMSRRACAPRFPTRRRAARASGRAR